MRSWRSRLVGTDTVILNSVRYPDNNPYLGWWIKVMMGMSLWMAVGLLVLLAAVGAAVLVGVRALRPHHESARELLDRRLATGELSPEEYFERESALRTQ